MDVTDNLGKLWTVYEDTLWTGVPGDYMNLEAPAGLAEFRKLVDSGDYAKATKQWSSCQICWKLAKSPTRSSL
ncbi:hypothetical protein J1N35_024566 [Gossypium stocksii]|uniref:Uncharacterized protein n=1 Tax=Gossypium stocksii TaxID=47602 RepID=A0A9D3V7N3_9ROSI|nr:hypothetical protein J1N35_024566 [Gossypium stocksii]